MLVEGQDRRRQQSRLGLLERNSVVGIPDKLTGRLQQTTKRSGAGGEVW